MSQQDTVRVTRFIEASPETVFGVISTPVGFSAWMDGEADFEPRPGSPFQIRFPQFATVISGTVVEVVPARCFAVTWGASEGPQVETLPAGSSTVRIELEPQGDGTSVTLTHSDFVTPEEATNHEAGWRFHLSRLQLKANRGQLEDILPDVWDAWCRAWSESDDAVRQGHLERCCVSDFQYADDYATLEDRDTLSVHIANSLRYVAHAKLAADGPFRVCRGEALIPWRGEAEDGTVNFRGTLHARVRPDGRFVRVTSFWDQGDAGSRT